ncbi:TetR family transcriptional regulator [Paraburkholderia sp. MM6662-R1]|uniref:TetR family transcriptional regulator n=1 Tax=Paraburkholderia sp. MM6662-R1 TaxID=2991066 RepID=UPI003D21B1E7
MSKSRPRNRKQTKDELKRAIQRVKDEGLKMSITAVAAAAGVNPSLIHNTYPDVAEEIRAQIGRSTRKQRDAKAAALYEAQAVLKDLREELRVAKFDIAKLTSINETLREEITYLKAQIMGKVLTMPTRQREPKS